MKKTINMNSKFLTILTLAIVLYSCIPNKQEKRITKPIISTQKKIQFEWESFELNGKKYEHGAILLPIQLDSLNKEFKMQFDLGLNVSGIYEKPLNTIVSKYPYLKNLIKIGDDYEIIKVNTKIDHYNSTVDSLFIFKDYGDNKTYDDLSIIGSIGANELEKKILIIDFKNQTLEILKNNNELNENQYNFVPLKYKYGKIFIPLSINGNIYNYMFDTGASITPITTIDKSFFSEVSKNSINLDTVKMNSWGKLATFIKTEIKVPIQIGEINIKSQKKSIFYTEEEKIIETFNQVEVKGLIGNDFFINNIIVIDLINNKFGISKE